MSVWPTDLQMRQKPTGIVSLGKDQCASGQWRIQLGLHGLQTLFSGNISDSLDDFSLILSMMRGADVIIYETPFFSWKPFPKILQEPVLLRSCLGCLLSLQNPGTVLIQFWQDQRQITPISVNMLWTMFILKMCAYVF